jgi:hypothetical protein
MAYDITIESLRTGAGPEDLNQSLLAAKGSIETLLRDWQTLDERNRLQLLSVALLSIHQTAFALQRVGEVLVTAGKSGSADHSSEVFRLPE